MKYRVHRFNIRMTADQTKLEQFLNSLDGEAVQSVPDQPTFSTMSRKST